MKCLSLGPLSIHHVGCVICALVQGAVLAADPCDFVFTGPSQGDVLVSGTTVEITWEPLDPSRKVSFSLSNSSDPWNGSTLAQSATTGGHVVWEICPYFGDGGEYRIRAVISDCPNVLSEPFSIVGATPLPTITMKPIRGGNTFVAGTHRVLEWETTEPHGHMFAYLESAGQSDMYLGGAPLSVGRLEWSVCSSLGDADDYWLQLWPSFCNYRADSSLDIGPITVIGSRPKPSIQLTSPIGGEVLVAGQSYRVTWSVTDPAGLVTATLIRESGTHASAPGAAMRDGSLELGVCPFAGDGDGFELRLDTEVCGIRTTIDSIPVTVVGSVPTPSLNILTPNGGTVVQAGRSQVIQWIVTDPVGDVRVWVMRNGVGWEDLGTVPMADGEVVWEVCEGIDDTHQYTIFLASVNCTRWWKSVPFTVTGSTSAKPEFTLFHPRGGETFRAGDHVMIEWESRNIDGEIEFLLLLDDGSRDSIGIDPASQGWHEWIIDSTTPTAGTYRLWPTGGNCGWSRERSGLFTIVALDAGDLNGDGVVGREDAEEMGDCLAGPHELMVGPCLDADANGDQLIDLRDVMLVFRFFEAGD